MSCKSLKTKALGTKKPQEQSWGVKVDQPGLEPGWTSLGLNQGPPDYESVALTN